ncbi:hypothetical protein WL29_08200 [Burkholderia ubonensis]|uniref:Uncharacterized protein n=1 Tax=Burkholderia ubonensis TaxID=101571 RepID=A0A119H6Z6_9BURK|nr:hypothetical protein [Burkholderia ubonensis]KVG38168.1 hypothetical protein WJ31_14525 [Burkholderia ubonensis]KWA70501.1 hypothetical protein WL29_08200 [Burkholderia ubonensis]
MSYDHDGIAPFETFRNDRIESHHGAAVHRYIVLRVIGRNALAALASAFGPSYAHSPYAHTIIDLIETSDFYMNGFARGAAQRDKMDSPLWNAMSAARVLISIATDETAKRAERIAAAKELNVLYGITIIDDKGNTRRSMTLDELLKMTPTSNADAHKAH